MDWHPYSPEEQKRFDELQAMFEQAGPFMDGRKDHLGLDYEKLLNVGVEGLMAEIKERCAALDLYDPAAMRENWEKKEFYDGCLIELEALADLNGRYVAALREKAEAPDTAPQRKCELLEMAEVLSRVPMKPARTFREALQSMHFYTYNMFGLYCTGRPDQLLWPYYEHDMAEGCLTRDMAQELIDNYCLLVSTYTLSRLAAALMVGGTDRDGTPVENELTFMFLTAIDHIHMALPGTALCVSDGTSDELMDYALSLIKRGNTHPSFYNDRAIVESLIRLGFEAHDAHMYTNTTCAEISIIGKSNMWTTCPYHNLLRTFEKVLYARKNYDSFEDLYASFEEILRSQIVSEINALVMTQVERARNGADPLRMSCLVSDCIARGRSVGQGGAVYSRILPAFVGGSNVADALTALKILVFDEKKISYQEYMQALRDNYEGHESLRRYILDKVPHYGNDEPVPDGMMKRVSDTLENVCAGLYNLHGQPLMPGQFAFSTFVSMGRNVGATPDGRLKGEPLADSTSAVPGRDHNGPTAMLKSASSWDQSRFMGGIVTNLRLEKSMLSQDFRKNLGSMIRVFMDRRGVQMQINVVSADDLREAMEKPEQYRDLLVRIGGYSDFFVQLTRDMQLQIISRTMHGM